MKQIIILTLLSIILQVHLQAQGSVMIAGGGSESSSSNSWNHPPYSWFVEQAGFGKIINIDTSETADWYAEYFISLGADPSSHGLRIANVSTANDSTTYYELISATGIFMEGGDQYPYVENWRGTLVEDAINYVFNAGGAIGGTSAGAAVMGEVVFDARFGSVYADDVALNPYHYTMHFEDDFLQVLPGILVDSHFNERGRLGRLVPMLARRNQEYGEDLLGIGVEYKSAVCIDQNGLATVWGTSATFVHATNASQVICDPGTPARFIHIDFNQLLRGAVFNINTRQLVDPGDFLHTVDLPEASELTFTPITLDGTDENSIQLGDIVVNGMNDNENNWWYGNLWLSVGQGSVPLGAVIPELYDDYDLWPNHWVGGMLAPAVHPHYFTIYLASDCSADIDDTGVLTAQQYTYVLDTSPVTHTGLNDYDTPGIINGRLHFLTDGDELDLALLTSGFPPGDMNQDHVVDVIDIIQLVTAILDEYELSGYELSTADVSGDGMVDILDVVVMVIIILEQ